MRSGWNENRSQYDHGMRTSLAAVGVVALVLAACGSDDTSTDISTDTSTGTSDSGAGEPATTEAPFVVASTSIWADITRNVACDGLAEVDTIVPLGGDPHSFEPSLQDRETMEGADLIVANGLFLEESLADTIDAVEQRGVPVVYAADAVDVLNAEDDDHEGDGDDHESDADDHEGETDDHENDADDHESDADHDESDSDHDGDEHAHEGGDPHIWFDPNRVIQTLPLIADGLADAGVDADALDACVADYTDQLTQLDGTIDDTVSALAVDRRMLVTNHDSLEYFADRYDFEVVGTVIPSSSSLAEASPADLEALADTIERTGVPAIFTETQHSSADAEALADRVDVEVVELLTGTLDEPGTPGGDYVGWLQGTAGTIVDALAG